MSRTALLGERSASGADTETGSVESLGVKLSMCRSTRHQQPRHRLLLTSSPTCSTAEFLEGTEGQISLETLWWTNTTKIQAPPSLSHGVTFTRVPVLQTHDYLSSSSSARGRHCHVHKHWAMHMPALEMVKSVLFLCNNVFPKQKIWKLKNVGWYFWKSGEIT